MTIDGAMVLAVAVVAVALPIGFDLVLSDLGRHLEVNRRLGLGTLVSFVTLVLPLTALMLTQAHQQARTEDEDLLQEVAQKIRREQGTLVVNELDPSKRTRLQNRIAIRSGDQTYRLSDAEFEKEVAGVHRSQGHRDAAACGPATCFHARPRSACASS